MEKKVEVIKCTNSTIREAWIGVSGSPSKIDEDELSSGPQIFKKSNLKDLKSMPVLTVKGNDDRIVSPFWTHQFQWDKGRKWARSGHKYLSVHAICSSDMNYSSFAHTLKPDFENAIKIYCETLTQPDKEEVNALSFGYINEFDFKLENFNLSDFFELNYEIAVGTEVDTLINIDFNFGFIDSKSGLSVNIGIKTLEIDTDKDVIKIKTAIEAKISDFSDLYFDQTDLLMEHILKIQKAAKRSFFSFTTLKTHDLMGVVYAD